MKHLPSKKGVRRLMLIGACILFLLVTYHIVFNSSYFQQMMLKTVNPYLGINLQWDRLKFNGATGHFSGEDLSLWIPKNKTRITLKKFSLAISPLELLLRKIHLVHLTAEELIIDISALQPPRATQVMDSTPLTMVRPAHHDVSGGKTIQTLNKLANLFEVDRAELRRTALFMPNNKKLLIPLLELKARKPFFVAKRKVYLKGDQIKFLSQKFDAFLQTVEMDGSLAIRGQKKGGPTLPDFNGKLLLSELLLGFNKLPMPQNPSPGWDEILNPILEKKYPEGIPQNRSFAFVDGAHLPVHYHDDHIHVKNAFFDMMEGQLTLAGEWHQKKGDAEIEIKTTRPMSFSLLPLGKSKFRHAYEKFSLSLDGKGKLTTALKGDFDSKIELALMGNKNVPEMGDMKMSLSPHLSDGLVDIPDLKATLDRGYVNARGKMDLKNMTADLNVTAKDLSAHTVVRFFSTVDIPGMADVKGSISGSLKNPKFSLAIESGGFAYEGLFLGNFRGNLLIENQNLKLSGVNSIQGQGSGSVELKINEVFRSSKQTVDLDVDFRGLPAGPMLKTEVLSGQVTGNFNMKKEGYSYNGGGNITISQINWYGLPIQTITGKLSLKDKNLAIQPIDIVWGGGVPTSRVAQGLEFKFEPEGYHFSGYFMPGLKAEGAQTAEDKDHIRGLLTAQNASFQFLAPLLPFRLDKLTAGGSAEVVYKIHAPQESQISSHLTSMEMVGEEKTLRLAGPANIDYEKGAFTFQNSAWKMGGGQISLTGQLNTAGNSNLRISGNIDLYQLTGFVPYLASGEGIAASDLTWQGSFREPKFAGRILFRNSNLLFRNGGRELAEINGALEIEGDHYTMRGMKFLYDDAPMLADGWIELNPGGETLTGAHLTLSGSDIPLSHPDTWRFTSDIRLLLQGSGGAVTLTGKLDIVEGLYYKDYVFSQFVLKPLGVTQLKKELLPSYFKNLHLNLDVRTPGEFQIKNNMADITFKGNMTLTGTVENPSANGIINVLEGEIHAVGIDFENASGFATFIPSKQMHPAIEFTASHEIQNYEIRVKIAGFIDNLNMSLESTPALGQNDIVSLIAYGRTPEQLAQSERRLFSSTAIASQVVGLIQRPLARATKLDIVKLESEYNAQEPVVTRLSIGKQLSDRFSLAFTTAISLEEAFKGVTFEYLILDNLLLKTTKDAGPRYRFDLTWRSEAY